MIDLGLTTFRIAVPTLERDEFERYTTRLFEDWERQASQLLIIPDYSLVLKVEEGSVKGIGKIAAALAAVYIGVGEYGDFMSGVQQIRSQVEEAGSFLANQAHRSLTIDAPEPKVRRYGGALAQLQRLFVKVQQQEISIDAAMHEAAVLLGENLQSEPRFLKAFQESLETAPLTPLQLDLPLEQIESPADIIEEPERLPPPAPPRNNHHHPPSLQLRVEVWRESKRGKRKVRVTEI